jgi:hypothetical protein
MSCHRFALVWVACLAAGAVGCRGCTDRAEVDAGERHEGISESPTAMDAGERHEGISESPKKMGAGERHEGIPQPPFMRVLMPEVCTVFGQQDEANRYSAAVRVVAKAPPDWPHRRTCAAVLVAPTLALTAAHCMCAPTRGASIRFDGPGCATKATVSFFGFSSLPPGNGLFDIIDGSILIHPEFQMALDAQGAVITSLADLAVIRLERPVRPEIQKPPIRLATEEVKAGDVLSVAGFCYYDETGGMAFDRWFTREKVQAPAGDDRFLFGPMDRADYKSDTGGPCLRETERGPELVGISQRGLGLTPTFTRIAPYRTWLEELIRLTSESH